MDLDLVKNPIVEAIYAAWKKRGDSEPGRRYLGASICGHECDRYLWLHFRGAASEDWEGRMYRLFDRGKREEAVFANDLRAIGMQVWEIDTETGLQFEVSAFGGHFSGHLDGMARGVPGAEKTTHVLEFKTHNDASFRKLAQAGVRSSKPMHFAQMQVYMGLTKLTRALYVAVNKDTDELYAERVEFDREYARSVMRRAKRIIESAEPPDRCASRETDFRCKLCNYFKCCWRLQAAAGVTHIDCRTCCRATPVTTGDGAVWTCELANGPIDIKTGETCGKHLLIPNLVNANFCDAGEDWIRYQLDGDGHEFVNGAGGFSSKELAAATLSALRDPAVNTARQLFDGEIQAVITKGEGKAQ